MILITGGAGYVGSVVAREVARRGDGVVVYDNLSQGHPEAVPPSARLVVGDLLDPEALDRTLGEFPITAVFHLAAEAEIEQSVTDPRRFFDVNVVGGLNLLNTMVRRGITTIIFSSSAAVYGEPESVPIVETHVTRPLNAYGESKLMFERILGWYGRAYGVRHVSFRYFNAAGAVGGLGEHRHSDSRLIPRALRAARTGERLVVFGTDYPTRDGTGIRDFIHVHDIARAHVAALEKIDHVAGAAYNLGTERGLTVLEVVRLAEEVTGRAIAVEAGDRRAGDPSVLVASAASARQELDWEPAASSPRNIIQSAWEWHAAHPDGYGPSPQGGPASL